MADNVQAASGTGGPVFKTDEDTGTSSHVPITKIELGANNSFDGFVSSANPMPVSNVGNTISTNNSTTSTLLSAASFTGTGDDVSEYAAISVTIYADVASATDGMKFQFSTDNSNWDDTYSFTLSAGTTRRFQFPVTAQYFRVNYTNGGTGQTAFRVQTILNKHNILTSIHRLADDMDPDRSAQVVKSVLYAQAAGTGNFTAVDTTAGGNLKVSVEEGVNTPSDAYATPSDALNVAAINMVYNGTTWDFVREGGEAGSILVDLGANNDVTVAGVSTAANQTTIIGHVDGIEALLTTIDADTSSMATDLGTLAGAVAAGQMQVDVVTSALPTGAATAANQSTANSSLSTIAGDTTSLDGKLPAAAASADNFANPTTTNIMSMNMVWDGATWDRVPGSLTDGVLVNLGTNNDISGTVTANAGTGTFTVDGSGVTQPVSGTVTANLGATDNAVLDQIEVNTSYGDQTGGGTETGALRVTIANDSTGVVTVDDGGSSLTVDVGTALPAGDNNIGNVDIVTLPASTNTIEVVGDAAHDAAVAGNPLLVGMESRTTEPTAVGDGDAVRAMATSRGKQVTYPYAIPASTWSYASAAAVTDTADDAAKAAAGAGIRNYITGVQVFNGHDTVGTEVVIKDGSTVIWRGWAEQTGGGCSARFDPPLRGTANTAVNVANITTGSSTYFNLQGFESTE